MSYLALFNYNQRTLYCLLQAVERSSGRLNAQVCLSCHNCAIGSQSTLSSLPVPNHAMIWYYYDPTFLSMPMHTTRIHHTWSTKSVPLLPRDSRSSGLQ